METRELLKNYLKITGSTQQWVATQIGYTKSVINRWLSDKDPYVPCQDTIDRIDKVLRNSIKQLSNLK